MPGSEVRITVRSRIEEFWQSRSELQLTQLNEGVVAMLLPELRLKVQP